MHQHQTLNVEPMPSWQTATYHTRAHSGVTLPYVENTQIVPAPSRHGGWCTRVSGSTFTLPSRISVTTYLQSQLQPWLHHTTSSTAEETITAFSPRERLSVLAATLRGVSVEWREKTPFRIPETCGAVDKNWTVLCQLLFWRWWGIKDDYLG